MNTLKMMKNLGKLNFRLMLKIAYIVNVAQSKCLRNMSIGMYLKVVVAHHTQECEKINEFKI
jgi:hypothetical protein